MSGEELKKLEFGLYKKVDVTRNKIDVKETFNKYIWNTIVSKVEDRETKKVADDDIYILFHSWGISQYYQRITTFNNLLTVQIIIIKFTPKSYATLYLTCIVDTPPPFPWGLVRGEAYGIIFILPWFLIRGGLDSRAFTVYTIQNNHSRHLMEYNWIQTQPQTTKI